jgi:hypothetical protein
MPEVQLWGASSAHLHNLAHPEQPEVAPGSNRGAPVDVNRSLSSFIFGAFHSFADVSFTGKPSD